MRLGTAPPQTDADERPLSRLPRLRPDRVPKPRDTSVPFLRTPTVSSRPERCHLARTRQAGVAGLEVLNPWPGWAIAPDPGGS
jgi:hypothetical protein